MHHRPSWPTLLAAAYLLLAGCAAAVAAGLALVASRGIDLVTLLGMLAAAILLVGSALWLVGSRRRISAAVVPFGAIVGIVAGLAPMAAIVSLIGASYITAGPIELGFGLLMLVWAVCSAAIAIRAWRAHRAEQTSGARQPAP